MGKLTQGEVKVRLGTIPEWRKKGSVISREFKFKDFVAAMKFVNLAAKAAEKSQHHPDIDIRWNKVTMGLTTHDAGGLTEKDFEMATRLDKLGK